MRTLSLSALLFSTQACAFNLSPSTASRIVHRQSTTVFAAADYSPMDGEKKMNLKIDLDSPKVATQDSVCQGDKTVYCRCWLSDTFPLCDGTHVKHNKATGDNVGPLIVSGPKVDSNTKQSDKKLAGRKKRVIMGYKAIVASYVALAAFIFSKGGFSKFPLFFAAGNVSMPAAVAYVMVGAAENDRLKSDTYKRLNLALLEYGVLGFATVALAAEKKGNPLAYLPFLLTMINSSKGYAYGVLGWDKKSSDTSLIQDFSDGIKSTIKGLFALPKSIKGSGYLAATLLVGGLKLSKLVEMYKFLLQSSGLAGITPILSRFNRLAFLTTVLYTLKDAADRDRLSGSTFIKLNYLAAMVMAANSMFLGGPATKVGGVAIAFATFFAFNGLSSFFARRKV
jgi:CDGSH-type Zn-finger protein